MFWERKEKQFIGGSTNKEYNTPSSDDIIIPQYRLPTPPKKEFETMLQVLRDAEKYDKAGDVEVRNYLLTALSDHIEKFKTIK